MNIAKLITPIGVHLKNAGLSPSDDTEQTESRDQPIAPPNEMQHQQRFYFKEAQITEMLDTDKDSGKKEKQSKSELLNNELEGIERMKSKFEQRKKIENQQSSIERAANRSIERHNLKPSAVPKMTAQTSEFQFPCLDPTPVLKNPVNEEAFSFKMEPHQIIYLDHDSLFQHQDHIDPKAVSSSGMPISKQSESCQCQSIFSEIMRETRQTISQLSLRVSALSHQNVVFKEQEKKMNVETQAMMNRIVQLQKQKEKLLSAGCLSNVKRQQCNVILKQTSGNLSGSGSKKLLSSIASRRKDHQSSSLVKKAANPKVQTLLQRLQLRIQKS